MRLQGWHIALICLTLAAAALAPYASQLHDGFEAVMERLGMSVEEPNVNTAPLPDYSLPGAGSERARQFVAVVAGMLAVFAISYGAATLLARRRGHEPTEPPRGESDAEGERD